MICAGSRVNSGSMKCGRGRRDHEVDPVAGMSTRGTRVDDLVDLRDHDAALERGGLDDRRRVFGVRAGVEVAVRVGRLRRDQRDPRRQVDEVAREQLEVGVDRADPDAARRRPACASRAPCGPENEKSRRDAMPLSNRSRCSGSASTDCTMCRSCTRAGSTPASACARKSACFWLLPSRQTRSPGSITASSSATASCGLDPLAGQRQPGGGAIEARDAAAAPRCSIPWGRSCFGLRLQMTTKISQTTIGATTVTIAP